MTDAETDQHVDGPTGSFARGLCSPTVMVCSVVRVGLLTALAALAARGVEAMLPAAGYLTASLAPWFVGGVAAVLAHWSLQRQSPRRCWDSPDAITPQVGGRGLDTPAGLSIERARAAMRELTEAVFVVDSADTVAFANPAAERMFVTVGDRRLVGRDIDRVLGPATGNSSLARVRAAVERACADPASRPDRLDGIEYDSRVYEVDVTPTGRGDEAAAVCVFCDVTAELEVDRLKDVFLSTVSHELRTPLTNICAYIELLRSMEPSASEWPEFLGVVEGESQRLTRHVQALLDFARLRAGEVDWRTEAVPVQRVFSEVQQLFAARLEEAGVELRIELPDDAEESCVMADPAWLIRCLSELVDNAIKFGASAESDGPHRVVLWMREGVRRRSVVFGVCDGGPGIPPLYRDTVFQELRQLGDGVTGKPDGLGLGLALARSAIEGMRGTLTCVEPADGVGACFRCVLPAARPAAKSLATLVELDED